MTGLPDSGCGRKLRTVESGLYYSCQPASDCTKSRLGQLGGSCQTSWKSLTSLSSCKTALRVGQRSRVSVSSDRPASARQPAAPTTPNRRPPPLCLPRLYEEKPKGGPPREINLFRSLSAGFPSRRLFPGCSDICLAATRTGFSGETPLQPARPGGRSPARAPVQSHWQATWISPLLNRVPSPPSLFPTQRKPATTC